MPKVQMSNHTVPDRVSAGFFLTFINLTRVCVKSKSRAMISKVFNTCSRCRLAFTPDPRWESWKSFNCNETLLFSLTPIVKWNYQLECEALKIFTTMTSNSFFFLLCSKSYILETVPSSWSGRRTTEEGRAARAPPCACPGGDELRFHHILMR